MISKMNKMTELMADAANLEVERENLHKFTEMEKEFKELHRQYQNLLTKGKCVQSTQQWFEPNQGTTDELRPNLLREDSMLYSSTST